MLFFSNSDNFIFPRKLATIDFLSLNENGASMQTISADGSVASFVPDNAEDLISSYKAADAFAQAEDARNQKQQQQQDFGPWNNFGKPADWQPDQNWQPPQNFDGGFNQPNFNQPQSWQPPQNFDGGFNQPQNWQPPQNWQIAGFPSAPATDASGFSFAPHDVSADQSHNLVADFGNSESSPDSAFDASQFSEDGNHNNQTNS